jgi:hypothetical protein
MVKGGVVARNQKGHVTTTLVVCLLPKFSMLINVHQTSQHVIVVLQARGLKPASVKVHLSSARDSVQVEFLQEVENSSLLSMATWTLRPLPQQSDDNEQGLTIQDCTCSVSTENMVLTIVKLESTEWQALYSSFKTCSVGRAGEEATRSEDTEATTVVRFTTPANAMHLLHTARAGRQWGSSSKLQSHVGHIEARRVPGVNAIQVTAGLVPESLQ